MYFII